MPYIYGSVENNIFYSEYEATEYSYYKVIYKIIYDGEIYNSSEIKLKLQEIGYNFSTYLEEEVVLKAYIEWGNDCVNKFDGIFTIIIWNENNKNLFIARDFAGVKPLYYSKLPNGIVFSNRIEQIIKNASIKAVSTYDKIFDLFVFENFNIDGNTVLNNIKTMLPATILEYNGTIKFYNYKDHNIIKLRHIGETTSIELRNMIVEEIIMQVIPDTEVFTIFSEGNCNLVLAPILSDILKEFNQRLYAVISDNNNEKIINYYDINKIKITKEIEINDVYKILKLKEIPDSVDYSNFYMALKEAKKQKDVCLSFYNFDLLFCNRLYDEKRINRKLYLLNNSFLSNVNKEFLIEDFYSRKENENYKYDCIIGKFLESREKIADYLNISLRNPFFSRGIIEYLKSFNINKLNKSMLYEIFEDFINISSMHLHTKRSSTSFQKYKNIIKQEYDYILHNPTSPILEIIDKEKSCNLNDVKLMKLIIEMNAWLKDYNINIW